MPRNFEGYRVATLDSETEPFSQDYAERNLFGRPFTMGFYSRDDDGTERYFATWGERCVADMLDYIDALEEPHLIYTHNGGRFDYHFLWDYIEDPLFIIDARLVEFGRGKARIAGRKKIHQKHVFRDSYSAMPVALATYKKTPVDYGIFWPHKRENPKHRATIEAYQRDDCRDLWELCNAFVQQFRRDAPRGTGWTVPLTVGQAAMQEFRQHHEFDTLDMRGDTRMRPYYFGGRVQCFAGGVIEGPWSVFDVNSSYPASMSKFAHPVSSTFESVRAPSMAALRRLDPAHSVFFAHVTARNRQGLPVRHDHMTDFGQQEGEFHACSHELVPAILSGQVEVTAWHEILWPGRSQRFEAFVAHWYKKKVDAQKRGEDAKERGDVAAMNAALIDEIFAKFMLNSCYGKFGTDPREFADWTLLRDPHALARLEKEGWKGETVLSKDPWMELAARPSAVFDRSFYNVSTAASITSASRSLLMTGLRQATDPIYCDTDSVICRAFSGRVSKTEIGAWKLEKKAQFAAVAGKKTYCLFNLSATRPKENHGKYRGQWIEPVKWASKGGQLAPEAIIDLATGAEFLRTNQAPTYSVKGQPRYITRTFRATVPADVLPFNAPGFNGLPSGLH
jgi:hypothetical protein